jgi:hypothetical protein
MFRRWYCMSEAEICELLWSEFLEHVQGIMIFEGFENNRTSLPMTDSNGMDKFRKAQNEQMDFIWDTMFPRSQKYLEEMEEKRAKFKAGSKTRMKRFNELVSKIHGRGRKK